MMVCASNWVPIGKSRSLSPANSTSIRSTSPPELMFLGGYTTRTTCGPQERTWPSSPASRSRAFAMPMRSALSVLPALSKISLVNPSARSVHSTTCLLPISPLASPALLFSILSLETLRVAIDQVSGRVACRVPVDILLIILSSKLVLLTTLR